MFKHILIPTDGSPVAAKAIKAGVALAKEMGAKVTGFYAIEPPPTHIYGEGYLAERKLVDELERLCRLARDAGYRALYGYILPGNAAMSDLARRLGFTEEAREAAEVTVVRRL